MTIFVKKKLTFILINLDNSLNMVNFFLKRKIKCVAVLLGYETNKAFCKYLGISESFLSLLINGHRTVSRKKMSQIIEKTKNCGKYAITLDDFFPNICEDNGNCNNKRPHTAILQNDGCYRWKKQQYCKCNRSFAQRIENHPNVHTLTSTCQQGPQDFCLQKLLLRGRQVLAYLHQWG